MGPPPPPVPPEKPPELAAPAVPPAAPAQRKVEVFGPVKPGAPTPQKPAIAPSGANTAFNPRPPPEDPSCRGRLTALNVEAEPTTIGKQPDPRCTVSEAVRLVSLTLPDGAKVDFPEKPTLACVTADAFSSFVRDLLAPLARGTYGVTVTTVWTGPGLDCRSRDHIKGAKLSAHGQGLAVDIAQMKLADGRLLAIGDAKTDRDKAFQKASQAAGCGYFHTALGPGTDSFHSSHWHFDLEQRGSSGDSKYCK